MIYVFYYKDNYDKYRSWYQNDTAGIYGQFSAKMRGLLDSNLHSLQMNKTQLLQYKNILLAMKAGVTNNNTQYASDVTNYYNAITQKYNKLGNRVFKDNFNVDFDKQYASTNGIKGVNKLESIQSHSANGYVLLQTLQDRAQALNNLLIKFNNSRKIAPAKIVEKINKFNEIFAKLKSAAVNLVESADPEILTKSIASRIKIAKGNNKANLTEMISLYNEIADAVSRGMLTHISSTMFEDALTMAGAVVKNMAAHNISTSMIKYTKNAQLQLSSQMLEALQSEQKTLSRHFKNGQRVDTQAKYGKVDVELTYDTGVSAAKISAKNYDFSDNKKPNIQLAQHRLSTYLAQFDDAVISYIMNHITQLHIKKDDVGIRMGLGGQFANYIKGQFLYTAMAGGRSNKGLSSAAGDNPVDDTANLMIINDNSSSNIYIFSISEFIRNVIDKQMWDLIDMSPTTQDIFDGSKFLNIWHNPEKPDYEIGALSRNAIMLAQLNTIKLKMSLKISGAAQWGSI